MSDSQHQHYEIVMIGDLVELTIVQLEPAVASYWHAQGAENLFRHTHRDDDGDIEEVPAEYQLPEWREGHSQVYAEGVEFHKGSIVVRNDDGDTVYEAKLDSNGVHGRHVKQSDEYLLENGYRGLMPCVIGETLYTGSIEYGLNVKGTFDPSKLKFVSVSTSETTAFVGSVSYDGETLEGSGHGSYREQSSRLYLDGKEPLMHSEEPLI